MKNVISKFFDFIFKDSLWKSIVFGAVLILVGGGLYYILNFSSKGRPDFIITAKEFKKNKLNNDLGEKDEIVSTLKKEDYEKKLNAFKSKFPGAFWDITERVLSDKDYEKKVAEHTSNKEMAFNLWLQNLISYETYSLIQSSPYPEQRQVLEFSMKGFMNQVADAQEIDSTDFDALVGVVDKMDYLYEKTDKIGRDTLMVTKFLNLLQNAKNLSIEEMKAVEKLHFSITKTPVIYSLRKFNSEKEYQNELFRMYQAAANSVITPERFTQLDSISNWLKNVSKINDTITNLNVLINVMEVDFSENKIKGETGYDLEEKAINEFFKSYRFSYNKENVSANFNKYINLYSKKLTNANIERDARELLRVEERITAKDWMYFGLFFLCISVIIVLLVQRNKLI